MKRSDEFRKAATECLALAQKTTDAGTRLSLLTMAEKLSRACKRAFAREAF